MPLVGMVSHHIWSGADEAERDARAVLAVQAEVLATNLGNKLKAVRYGLEYLAAQPHEGLLDSSRCSPAVRQMYGLHPGFANVFTTDPEGNVRCSAVALPPDAAGNPAVGELYRKFLNGPGFMVSAPLMGPIVKKQVIVIKQPIFEGGRSDGKLLGSVNATFPVSSFDPELPDEHLPKELRYGFDNLDGVPMWRNQEAGAIGTRLRSPAADRIVQTRDGAFVAMASDGADRYYAVKSLPDFCLVAFVGLPVATVRDPAVEDAIQEFAVAITLIALLLFALVSARRIEEPINALHDAMVVRHAGDISALAPTGGPREVADLADAFNSMVKALQDKQAELSKLSTVVEQTPNPVMITDLESRIQYVNDAFVTKTGYARAEVLGQSPALLRSGQTPQSIYDEMWEALHAGRPWKGEFINRTRSGAIRIEAATIQPLHQGDGRITHYVAIKQDITEDKRLREELQRHRDHLEAEVAERTAKLHELADSLKLSNEEQQALFDAAVAGIVYIRDRRVVRLNRALADLFACKPEDMLNETTRSWYDDDATFDEVGRRIRTALSKVGFYREERELIRKDGSRFWAQMSAQAIDRGNLAKGLVGMILDVTAERRAFAAMQEAQRLAEDAARTKSDFLANMSHEIRTPMNAIIGMTHLALKTELSPKQHDYLNKIRNSGHHLLGIINDILDLSKIEAGKMTVEQIDFDLDSVLENVSGLLAERAAGKGLELVIQVDDNVPRHLVGDPLRVGQVLINYANNAVKFTESGYVAIHVRLQETVDDQVTLWFSVEDTGIGLDHGHGLWARRSHEGGFRHRHRGPARQAADCVDAVRHGDAGPRRPQSFPRACQAGGVRAAARSARWCAHSSGRRQRPQSGGGQ